MRNIDTSDMPKTEREFKRRMKKMLRTVIRGEPPISKTSPTPAELEVLAECVKRRYLTGCIVESNGELPRNQLGLPMVDFVEEKVVTFAGLQFLAPDRTRARANAALIISLLSLLVTTLHALPTIIPVIHSIVSAIYSLFSVTQ